MLDMNIDILKSVLYSLIIVAPILIAYLVGIVIAVVKIKKHHRNSKLTIVIFTLSFIITIGTVAFNSYAPFIRYSTDVDIQTVQMLIAGANFLLSLLMAVVWGLIVYLIFFRSQPKQKE